ncbi:hypothetical protein P9112_009286 [Eukaryota sp. TZLM1-RC]
MTTSIKDLVYSGALRDPQQIQSFVQSVDPSSYQSTRDTLLNLTSNLRNRTGQLLNDDYPLLIRVLEQVSSLYPTVDSTQSSLSMCHDVVLEEKQRVTKTTEEAESMMEELQRQKPKPFDVINHFNNQFWSEDHNVTSAFSIFERLAGILRHNMDLSREDSIKARSLFLMLIRLEIEEFSRLVEILVEYFAKLQSKSHDFHVFLTFLLTRNDFFKYISSKSRTITNLVLKNIINNHVSNIFSKLINKFSIQAVNSLFVEFDNILKVIEQYDFKKPIQNELISNYFDNLAILFESESLSFILSLSFDSNSFIEIYLNEKNEFNTNFGLSLFCHLLNLNNILQFCLVQYCPEFTQFANLFSTISSEFQQYFSKVLSEKLLSILENQFDSISSNLNLCFSLLQDFDRLDTSSLQSFYQSNLIDLVRDLSDTLTTSLIDHLQSIFSSNLISRLSSLKVIFASVRVKSRELKDEPSQFIKQFLSDFQQLNTTLSEFKPNFVDFVHLVQFKTIEFVLNEFYFSLEKGILRAKETENSLKKLLNSSSSPNVHSSLDRLYYVLNIDLNYFKENFELNWTGGRESEIQNLIERLIDLIDG